MGEVWFDSPDGRSLTLLVKYILTSDRLSIQVHPDDRHARAHDLPHGKDECWYVVDAEPSALLGIGLKEKLDAAGI